MIEQPIGEKGSQNNRMDRGGCAKKGFQKYSHDFSNLTPRSNNKSTFHVHKANGCNTSTKLNVGPIPKQNKRYFKGDW